MSTNKKPYTKEDISQFFKQDTVNKVVYFIGDKLDIYIPIRYEDKGLLTITERVSTLAIFDMVINDTINVGFLFAATITIEHSQLDRVTIDNEQYLHLTLYKNDRFMCNTDYIKNDKFGYILWVEFIALGRLPRFITYENVVWLFDRIAEVIGVNFGVNHSVFEMLYAHLFRDSNDLSVKYRLTKMDKPPTMIELRNVAYGPDDTMSKILGSYMNVGLNAALITESTQPSPIEIHLRS
jgi:hypothetical protein